MIENLRINKGNITLAETDAIVNAANPAMLGGGGVDGAIHRAAGSSLRRHCEQLPVVRGSRCPIGAARITPAGNLAARWVIHTVGPRYYEDAEPHNLLKQAYQNSLLLAKIYNCRSVTFPAISCGVYGYPYEEAAQIAIKACLNPMWNEMAISFCLFSDDIFTVWQNTLAKIVQQRK